MISARKLSANRANARASTGPRTAAGKIRAARNARQHGLSIPVLADPALTTAVKALAREIAGEGANAKRQELASCIAEAQLDLIRVRCVRHAMLLRVLGKLEDQSPAAINGAQALVARLVKGIDSDMPPMPVRLSKLLVAELAGKDMIAATFVECAARMLAMDRYERRALSRRKFAIREFDAARQP